MSQGRLAGLAALLGLALAVPGCGGDSGGGKAAGPAGAGQRIATRPAKKVSTDDAYKASGQILADSGFRPEKDGFSFQNYGTGFQELTPADVEELFGSRVCSARQGSECVLTPPAQAWMNQANKLAGNGHCYGFSLVSLKFFDKLLSPLDYGAPSPRALTLPGNVALQRRLAESWAVQMTPQVQLADYMGTPNQILDQLIAGLKNHPDTYTLLIFRRGWKDGHAITPYAVEDKGGGQFSVLLYDNNYPGVTRAAQFDRNKNTWQYEASTNPQTNSFLYEGDAQTRTTFLSPTSATIGVQACPFCPAPAVRSSVSLPKPTGGTRRVDVPAYEQVSLTGDSVNHAHLLLTDAQGRKTGYVGDRFVQQIPGVRVVPISTNQNWLLKPEPNFLVPRGLKVSITIDGSTLKAPDSEALSVIGPGYSAVLNDIAVRPRQRAVASVRGSGTKVVYQAPAGSSQSPGLELGFTRPGADRTFAVATHRLRAGGKLTASVNAAAGKVLLGGVGGHALVNFKTTGSSGTQTFHQATLPSAGGTCDFSRGRCRKR